MQDGDLEDLYINSKREKLLTEYERDLASKLLQKEINENEMKSELGKDILGIIFILVLIIVIYFAMFYSVFNF